MSEKIKYYKVGGAVRDQIIGVPSKDIDYSVEAPSYSAMKEDILKRGGTIYLETPEYFTIRGKLGKEDADFVLCRKDGAYKDSRHPDSVEMGTIYDDLARRDFTMNSIAIDSETGEYLDPFGGIEDTKRGLIKCTGSVNRLYEDSLRMLRAIRFSVTKGFVLDLEIHKALIREAERIRGLSVERIREEMKKMFDANTVRTLEMIGKYDIFFYTIFSNYKLKLEPKIYG